jgi:transcriptional regulator with XRE-family HTH domain
MMYWWSSYGPFEPDASGLYPQARQVLSHYRQLRCLTREQVASRLGVGAKSIYYAEHEGRGLDSISRLRGVGALLHVPSVLLGLVDPPGPGDWWADYGPFPAGPDGWPAAGYVVKHYRRAKRWTQQQLAAALGVEELSVRSMENKNAGLDSLARRRALRFLLGIPPALLGLDAAHAQVSSPAHIHGSAPALPSLDEIRQAQQRLWTGYYVGHGQNEFARLTRVLPSLKDHLSDLPFSERSDYLEQMSLFCQAAGNIVLASADTHLVLSYQNLGVKLARFSENIELLSTALGRRAAALYELGEQDLAEKSIKEALFVAPDQEKVFRYPVASRVLSCTALDECDRSEIYRMLDQLTPNERFNTGLDSNIILVCKAQCLVNLSRNAPNSAELLRESIRLLEQAERSAPDTPRRYLLINLFQAMAHLGLRQYDLAAFFAIEAFQLMRQIKSVLYLPQFIDMYQTLQKSSFAGSPQVARLGLLLYQVGVAL